MESTDTSLRATLSGTDEWQGIPLKELQGQNFSMTVQAQLNAEGLHLDYSITSEDDSLIVQQTGSI